MCISAVRNCTTGYYLKIGQTPRRSIATLIDGKSMAASYLINLKKEVEEFRYKFLRIPTLAAILVGDDASSRLYIKNKLKAAKTIGINSKVISINESVNEDDLRQKIHNLNNDTEIDSILIQLPLPSHLNPRICNEVLPEKDVDGFTTENIGKFYMDDETLVPCTALAVHEILKNINIQTTGKKSVVCGRSKHVSLPIAMLLHSNSNRYGFNTSTTICHRFTPEEDLVNYCRQADIIVSATGVPNLIRGHMVKKGAIVIDVGISRTMDPETNKEKIVGDIHFGEVAKIAGFLTPVPGGVGPLTVAMLMKNTLKAAEKRILR